MQAQIKPEVRIGSVSFGGDPVFGYGTMHVAHAQMTNPTPAAFTYSGELYLGAGKVATSGSVSFTLSAGQTKVVDFIITMPNVEGTWSVLLDIYVGTDLIAAYQATEDVSVTIPPDIDIGPIIWD